MVDILDVPEGSSFIAHLCIGYPAAEDDVPALQRARWEQRHDPNEALIRR